MTDKKLIIANWKMNFTIQESSLFVHKLATKIKVRRNTEVVLAPTMLCLPSLSLQIDRRQFKLAAQNLYWRDEGAFTGEVSARQLNGLIQYAIIGHSERRHIFGEHDKDTRAKIQAAVRNKITPILCVGETANERANGETGGVINDQVVGGLANTTAEEISDLVIAYEPVWAVGTGKAATPDDIKKAIMIIRRQIDHLYGKKASQEVRVIYGGSSNPSNAATILAVDGVDGLLVGGVSLNADEFSKMAEIVYQSSTDKK